MNSSENRPENVNDASARTASLVSRNLLITLIFAGILILYTLFQPHGMMVDFSDTALTVTDPDNQTVIIQYTEMKEAAPLASPVFGTLVSGRQSSSCWYGIYHNLMWEEYQLCIHPNCPQCIAVTFGDDSVFVFNGPNEDETAAYFEALYNQIKSVAR